MCKESSNSSRNNLSHAWYGVYRCCRRSCYSGQQSPVAPGFPCVPPRFPSPSPFFPLSTHAQKPDYSGEQGKIIHSSVLSKCFLFSLTAEMLKKPYIINIVVNFRLLYFFFQDNTIVLSLFFFFYASGLKVHTNISVLSKYIVYFFSLSALSTIFCLQNVLHRPF